MSTRINNIIFPILILSISVLTALTVDVIFEMFDANEKDEKISGWLLAKFIISAFFTFINLIVIIMIVSRVDKFGKGPAIMTMFGYLLVLILIPAWRLGMTYTSDTIGDVLHGVVFGICCLMLLGFSYFTVWKPKIQPKIQQMRKNREVRNMDYSNVY